MQGWHCRLRKNRRISVASLGPLHPTSATRKHDPAGVRSGNSRNGVRPKTVLTDVGPVGTQVPRDRESRSEPKIAKKRQRRSARRDEKCRLCPCRGLTQNDSQRASPKRRNLRPADGPDGAGCRR
ncbi:transposase [Streptomyces sp. NPDC056387]|uniref:transposase n=1 Tax=Streptomyces sp. NPDC056387 TaxID=3345803 RepID=UPI0035E3631D